MGTGSTPMQNLDAAITACRLVDALGGIRNIVSCAAYLGSGNGCCAKLSLCDMSLSAWDTLGAGMRYLRDGCDVVVFSDVTDAYPSFQVVADAVGADTQIAKDAAGTIMAVAGGAANIVAVERQPRSVVVTTCAGKPAPDDEVVSKFVVPDSISAAILMDIARAVCAIPHGNGTDGLSEQVPDAEGCLVGVGDMVVLDDCYGVAKSARQVVGVCVSETQQDGRKTKVMLQASDDWPADVWVDSAKVTHVSSCKSQ